MASREPRVALDVTTAVTQRAGVGRYARDLFEALQRVPDGPHIVPFAVTSALRYPLGDGAPAVAQVRRGVRAWRIDMAARHVVRRIARGPWDGADLYHAPDVVYPPVAMPVVTTVHDLSYIVYPRFHTRLNGGYLRVMTPAAMRRARLVIAVSTATARDLEERAGVPAQRIRVVYSGVSPRFARRPSPECIEAVRHAHGLDGDFILSVGTLEPRKNLAATLRAYGLLRQRRTDAPVLVLVGASGWGLDEQDLIAPRDAAHVRRLGYVPDDDLAALYAACNLFVYPSLYEGWGMPVAEALALGAPTVTSNLSSLPEVAGDAALLVDPHDQDALAVAMEEVLYGTETAARLRAAGPEQAAHFSPEQWARATIAVYREALG